MNDAERVALDRQRRALGGRFLKPGGFAAWAKEHAWGVELDPVQAAMLGAFFAHGLAQSLPTLESERRKAGLPAHQKPELSHAAREAAKRKKT